MGEWCGYLTKISNKEPLKMSKTEETLKLIAVLRYWPFNHQLDLSESVPFQ